MIFSCGYNGKKSKVLYSAAKDRMPNAMISTCFKKHLHEILNEKQHNEKFLGIFFYLPSITDWKEKINQHMDNVSLNSTDCILDYSNAFSPGKEVSFQPYLLNSANAEFKRIPQVELLYRFFRWMAERSNANLVRNADYLLATNNKDSSNIVWVGLTEQRFDTTKFKLKN